MSESASPQNFFPTIGMLADISEEYLCFLRYYGKYLRPPEGETIITEGADLESPLQADPVIGLSVLRALLRQMSKRIRAMNDKLTTAEKKSSLHEFWTNTLR
jgi:hypothetical protein